MAKDKDFWQLLNLRGSVANKPVALFGTDAKPEEVITLDKKVTIDHLVLVSPTFRGLDKVSPEQTAPTLDGDEMIASQIRGEKVKHADSEAALFAATFKGRWPYVNGQIYWSDTALSKDDEIMHYDRLEGETHDIGERSVRVSLSPDVENRKVATHAAFYKAAQGMRELFRIESLGILKWVPKETRRYAQIVTLVDTPIWADWLYNAEGDQEPGVEVRATYTQYVIVGECDPRRWHTYSTQGEYPMDIPKDIDVEFLIDIDKQLGEDNSSIDRLLRARR